MPQIQLPIFPTGCTAITQELAFEPRDGTVDYFNGHLPVFSHPVDDIASFRFFTSQLVSNGNATQSQISSAFGVPHVTVKRSCKKLRDEGAAGFFRPAEPRQGHKLTGERIALAQAMLDEGFSVPAIGTELGVLPNTLHKTISYGRLKKNRRPTAERADSGPRRSHHPKCPQRRRWRGPHGRRHHPHHGSTPLSLPRLLSDIPNQPTTETLAADPHLHRFTLVFDREGYSPALFARLKTQRIAILTYHKHSGPDRENHEFVRRDITHPSGEISTLLLAERGTRMSNGLWLRELRRLDESGHQTSILSTDCRSDLTTAAASMFARWNQENFFKHMRQHYGLDRLAEYGTSPLPDTTRLVNPARRALDSQARRVTGLLTRQRAAFAAHTLALGESSPAAAARHEQEKGAALSALEATTSELDTLRTQRKATPKHIEPGDLPPEQRIELQGQANPIHDEAVAALCSELNATETHYPGTELRRKHVPVRSPRFPGGQDV